MRSLIVLVMLALATACGGGSKGAAHAEKPCRDGPADDAEVGVRTGAEGVKTGVTTAAEGVKTFGSSTAGLVEGGRREAKERWRAGSDKTRDTAKKGARETAEESQVPRCR